ncbi:glycoside hydrolase family 5 protein, partial [Myxococcota bacterium]
IGGSLGSSGMTAAGGAVISGTGEIGTGGSSGSGQLSSRTSTELIASLNLGWNLGNSLDAPEGETAWGNPTVTEALLQAVAESGFDLVRIPVTWSLHIGATPDYVIEPGWLERVEEVVQYAIGAGLYAIINLHHDGADAYDGVEWLTLNDAGGAVTAENNDQVEARFVGMWTQIASHFRDHGEQLLFESMNEIHDGYDTPDPAYYDIINHLNQVFVDTVRATGGNNGQRHLVVPGYNTNIDYTVAGFEVPTDPTPNRLILSVHYYDPWDFAGSAKTNAWGQAAPGRDSWGQEDHVVAQFDKLQTTYVQQGIAVVLGEYGAVHQAGFEDYRRYYMEYVTKAAADRDILPIYWDNGSESSGEEAFGLFSRTTNAVLHPTILEAMMRAATSTYSLNDVTVPTP